ncbi:hypothetical protein [Thermoflavimicrobium daqui]|uniref:Uncharacterized protein n=1 Tax=Thermoflavimicrobium daqui TaxID=2137476 RepID=A0A364K6Y1_9BACL|nr:hypothetical protein [Thermoflavimicrobium daqui]RAL26069.1 hypothetical protein DL897_03430 [Thermoflavimicrobium daqui]
MKKFKYVPPHQLNLQHIGKPTKLLLKNGKVLYGTIKEVRKNGIIFIPAQYSTQRSNRQTHTSWFRFIFPIFIPFRFFVPIFIF